MWDVKVEPGNSVQAKANIFRKYPSNHSDSCDSEHVPVWEECQRHYSPISPTMNIFPTVKHQLLLTQRSIIQGSTVMMVQDRCWCVIKPGLRQHFYIPIFNDHAFTFYVFRKENNVSLHTHTHTQSYCQHQLKAYSIHVRVNYKLMIVMMTD